MSWQKFKVKDFSEIIGGGTPSTNNLAFWDGEVSWITPKDLSNYTNRFNEIPRGRAARYQKKRDG